MIGPEGVARAMTVKVRQGHQTIIKRLRERNKVDRGVLPSLREVFASAPPPGEKPLGEWPYAFVTVADTTGRLGNREKMSTGLQDVFERVYRVSVTVMVQGTSLDSTTLLNQRLALAVRDGILLDRMLSNLPDGDTGEVLTKDMTEKFYDAVNDKGRFTAGSIIQFPVRVEEHLLTDQAWTGDVPQIDEIAPPVPGYTTDVHADLGRL